MSTSGKCACSDSGHCSPSAVCSVMMYHGDFYHEDASSDAVSHSRKILDVI